MPESIAIIFIQKNKNMNTRTITKIIAILLLAMCSMPAFSQLRFGVRADVGLNNPSFFNLTETFKVENLTSFSVGGTLELMIPIVNFGIETSLLYNNNRMTVPNVDPMLGRYNVTNHYLLLPVNLKKKFGLGILPARLFVTTGVYGGYLISGGNVRLMEESNTRTTFPEGTRFLNTQAQNFKGGIGFGFGVELLRRLQVGVNYRLQLTDSYTENHEWTEFLNGKNSDWSLSATFFF